MLWQYNSVESNSTPVGNLTLVMELQKNQNKTLLTGGKNIYFGLSHLMSDNGSLYYLLPIKE